MAKYSFDGRNLKKGGRVIANVKDNKLREGSGATVVCNIRGNNIREGSGGKTVFNLRRDNICLRSGGSRIADIDDVNDAIDGPGGITKAALWLFFIR